EAGPLHYLFRAGFEKRGGGGGVGVDAPAGVQADSHVGQCGIGAGERKKRRHDGCTKLHRKTSPSRPDWVIGSDWRVFVAAALDGDGPSREDHIMITRVLKRNDCSSNRHPALGYCWSMIFFRKPVSTFRDHALTIALTAGSAFMVATAAKAAEIKLMCSGAMRPAIEELAPQFERV